MGKLINWIKRFFKIKKHVIYIRQNDTGKIRKFKFDSETNALGFAEIVNMNEDVDIQYWFDGKKVF